VLAIEHPVTYKTVKVWGPAVLLRGQPWQAVRVPEGPRPPTRGLKLREKPLWRPEGLKAVSLVSWICKSIRRAAQQRPPKLKLVDTQ
jgi:hypothetical protein